MMPQIDKWSSTRARRFAYEAQLEVVPDFTLPQYKGIEVKKKSAEVTDEDINKTLDMLREQRAEFVDVTGRALQMAISAS